MTHSSPSHPHRDTVLAATIYLITKYLQAPCPALGHAVADHLALLARSDGGAQDDSFRASLRRLAATWDAMAANAVRSSVRKIDSAPGAYLQ